MVRLAAALAGLLVSGVSASNAEVCLFDDDVSALIQGGLRVKEQSSENATWASEAGRPAADLLHPENSFGRIMNVVLPNPCKKIDSVDPLDMKLFAQKRWYMAWERASWTRSIVPRMAFRYPGQNDASRMCKSITFGGVEKTMMKKWDYFMHVRGRVGEGLINKFVGIKNGISDYKSCLRTWGEGNGKFTVGNCDEWGSDPGADPFFIAAHEEYPGFAIVVMGQPNSPVGGNPDSCTFSDSRKGVFIMTRDAYPRAFVLAAAAEKARQLGIDTTDLVRVTYPAECGVVQHPFHPNDPDHAYDIISGHDHA